MVAKMSELKSLEFSTLKTYYESVACYKKNNEPEIIIRVQSLDRASLEEFTKSFRVSFDEVTDEVSQPPQEGSVFSQRESEALLNQIELDREATEALPDSSLNIFIEVPKTMELKKQKLINYRFSDRIERLIDDGEIQEISPPRFYYVVGEKPTVTVSVQTGSVKVEVFRNKETQPVASNIFSKIDNIPLKISDFPIKPNDKFFLKVTGLGNTESKYTINGSWTVG
jgi:hypothetical protein